MNLLKKKVTKAEIFAEYTKIINGVLELSPRELEVFSFLLVKDSEGVSNVNHKDIRTELIKKFSITAPNLSHYLATLKEKGLIVRGEKGWVINDVIRPIIKDGVFELRFILEVV